MLPLTDDEVRRLGTEGWFLRDGFLGTALANEVRRAAEAMPLVRAGVRRGAQHTLDAEIRGDAIAWIAEGEATGVWAEVLARFQAIQRGANEAAWLGLRRCELMLARYPPGARYVRHLDAFPGDDNRRLTAIVYLNAGWRPEHGGRLRLYVEPPLEVEPVMDRLVVFRSQVLEHEVLESHAERWSLTAWFSGR